MWPEIIQTLVGKRGVLVNLGWGVVGGGTTIAAQSDCLFDKKMDVRGSSEA